MNRSLYNSGSTRQLKTWIIINPMAHHGLTANLQQLICNELRLDHSQILYTKFPYHATQLARKAARQGVKTIIAVGGDGTINEILNGINGSNIRLGIIPAGTANDLAAQYQVPGIVADACAIIRAGYTCDLDVIQVNKWLYCTAGGIGLPCQVAQIAESLKRNKKIGKFLLRFAGSKIYILALLLALLKKNSWNNPVKIYLNGYSRKMNLLWLMIHNQPKLGKRFSICPDAVNDDGLANYCLVTSTLSRLRILYLSALVLWGKHINQPHVNCGMASTLTITTEKPAPFLGDGQIQKPESVFNIRIIPRALKLIVPFRFSPIARDPGHVQSRSGQIKKKEDLHAVYSS